jgi:hypothetical protein
MAAIADGNLVADNPDFSQGTVGWALTTPWTIVPEEGRSSSACAFLDYRAEKQNKVVGRANPLPLTPHTYYRATAWCRTMTIPGEPPPRLLFYASQPTPPSLPLLSYATNHNHPFWNRIVHYFNSGENDQVNLLFFPQEGTTAKLWFDDLELQRLTEDDLTTCLLPNPDFEEGEPGARPCMWRVRDDQAKNADAPAVHITCDPAAAFITGTKSLRIDGSSLPETDDRQYGVESILVPAVPGKPYVLTVWLKAIDGEPTVRLIIDGWVQKHVEGQWLTMPHWYRETYVKATPEWRRYTLKATIPDENDKTHFLPERLARAILLVKGQGAVWIDECRLQQEQPPR